MKNQLDLSNQARYIGSLPKDDQLCDFYEVEVDGNISYVYVEVGSNENLNKLENKEADSC